MPLKKGEKVTDLSVIGYKDQDAIKELSPQLEDLGLKIVPIDA